MKKQKLLTLNLQFFSDEDTADAKDQTENNEEQAENEEKEDKAVFTQEQFEKEMARRIKAEKKKADEAIKEAEKLAKMNADQKQEYELQKLKEENEAYKKREAFYRLAKEATTMLKEQDIVADDDLLEVLVRDTAEDTQASVAKFAEIVNQKVEEGVKKALAGKSPRVTNNNGKPLTKADILNIKDDEQRLKAIQENPTLFNR
jgi:hypothetical protein